MKEAELSFVLEVINGGWALLALSLALVCLAYLKHELSARRLWDELARHGVRAWRWRLEWTPGMRVAAAIMTLSTGIFITRTTIYIWRAFYDAGDFGALQLYLLIFGAVIGAVGFLCAIREISMPLFGPVPWMATMVSLLLTTAAMLIFNF